MKLRIDRIPNRNSPPAILIRTSRREGGKIRHRTLANLSRLPKDLIACIETCIKGGVTFSSRKDAVTIKRSLSFGHVFAILQTCRHLGLDRLLFSTPCRQRDLALAAIITRIISPESKLATARGLSPATADSCLGPLLGLEEVKGNEMLDMLDWLLKRQPYIERRLAKQHLTGATMVLYDVSSSYLEGRHCELGAFGYNRDKKKGKRQIVYGLMCTPNGCPIAIEVFRGNMSDPATVSHHVEKVRSRIGIHDIALVGDRGMFTSARIKEDIKPVGLDWISALKSSDLVKLVRSSKTKTGSHASESDTALSIEIMTPDSMVEVTHPDYPHERFIVCLDPRLREQRRRKREELLQETEGLLEDIATSVRAKCLQGADNIGRRVGREANRKKVEKHFKIRITDHDFTWQRRQDRINSEARLDGLYAIRTSLPASTLGSTETVMAYKRLSRVERAFRTTKNRLGIRPIFVYEEDHVRAHIFLCMLAYYVEWHMRGKLAPLLFEDDDPEETDAERQSPVAPAKVSNRAEKKANTKQTADGYPVHSFATLIKDLSTMDVNRVRLPMEEVYIPVLTDPTSLQSRVFKLLNIDVKESVYSKLKF